MSQTAHKRANLGCKCAKRALLRDLPRDTRIPWQIKLGMRWGCENRRELPGFLGWGRGRACLGHCSWRAAPRARAVTEARAASGSFARSAARSGARRRTLEPALPRL